MSRRVQRFLPRPYQHNAVNQVLSLYQGGARKLLLHLPTGAGKTVVATLIIEQLLPIVGTGKILFIAHRKELLDQTADKLRHHLPRLKVSVDQGDRVADQKAQVIVASIQSLVHRKEQYSPDRFCAIICDECHRALAPSWSDVIDYFHMARADGSLLLGMTATPRRSDGRSALDVFERVAYEISRPELQDLGYLSPIRYWAIKAGLSLDKVKLSGGDFQVTALSAVMNTPQVRALTIRAWETKAIGKRTLGFCASIKHAHILASEFAALGHRVDVVEGRTKNREELLKNFREGKLDILLNYGVLTEGFDDPAIECVLLARPTTSSLVYNQCLGRGLRPSPGKLDCTVIDVVDRSNHQLQYNACTMTDLPAKWQAKGRDPFRESRSISQVQVTDPKAFLAVRNATSLEEIQDILMALPQDVVVAGLDGQDVPHYQPVEEACSQEDAEMHIRALLRTAAAPIKELQFTETEEQGPSRIEIALHTPEVKNEQTHHLLWHLERATGWTISLREPPQRKRGTVNPRALLRSMLPSGHRFVKYNYDEKEKRITAQVSGLPSAMLEPIRTAFEVAAGIELDLQAQLTFDFL